jgi:hypothetical protein
LANVVHQFRWQIGHGGTRTRDDGRPGCRLLGHLSPSDFRLNCKYACVSTSSKGACRARDSRVTAYHVVFIDHCSIGQHHRQRRALRPHSRPPAGFQVACIPMDVDAHSLVSDELRLVHWLHYSHSAHSARAPRVRRSRQRSAWLLTTRRRDPVAVSWREILSVARVGFPGRR